MYKLRDDQLNESLRVEEATTIDDLVARIEPRTKAMSLADIHIVIGQVKTALASYSDTESVFEKVCANTLYKKAQALQIIISRRVAGVIR